MPRKILARLSQPDEATLDDLLTVNTAMGANITTIKETNTAIEKSSIRIEEGTGEGGLIINKLNDIDEELKKKR